jgi:toxin secretion/phage lysis holin
LPGERRGYMLEFLDVSFVYILLWFFFVDILTGIMKSRRFKFSELGTGLVKKIAMLLIITLGICLDFILGLEKEIGRLLIFWFIGMEGISILDNSAVLGIVVPSAIKKILGGLKNEE